MPGDTAPPNILLITLDQFRADCLSCAGHPVVRTPHLDDLAGQGVRLARHYSQAAPCAPGRAALYTGTYQMNNRVVANGTPLDDRFDNIARAARRAGYAPALFGYTDQGVDPRTVDGPDDPRLSTYEGVLPGFDAVLDMTGWQLPWLQWLDAPGLRRAPTRSAALAAASTNDRPSTVDVDVPHRRLLEWLGRQDAAVVRPRSRTCARIRRTARPVSSPRCTTPPSCHAAPLPVPARSPPAVRSVLRSPDCRADRPGGGRPPAGAVLRDDQRGRRPARPGVGRAARCAATWDDTVIVVTADHGEQLGDHGLMQKAGFFE